MDINQALEYITSGDWKASKVGLQRISELMNLLDNPQKQLKIIHIAGTNGKGSTAAMIASVLQKANYHVGLFTSPHLRCYQERIILDGHNISNQDFIDCTVKVKEAANKMDEAPTVFEKLTAMALYYYAEKKTDIVVLEVGLGGRLDCTNVIDPPEVAVITNLGLEHTSILGHTIEEIATQKGGIIKKGSTVVCYDSEPAAVHTIQNICGQLNVEMKLADFQNIKENSTDLSGQCFDWKQLKNMKLSLLGKNQLHNVNVVLEVIEVLQKKGYHISENDVRNGLSSVYWPGRFEVLSYEPLFILDGGHNPQCVQSLSENLKQYLENQKVVFLMGVLAEKDYKEELQYIGEYAERFVCVSPNDKSRALPAEKLAQYIKEQGYQAESADSLLDGLKKAFSYGLPVVAFGSLYLAGDILNEYIPLLKKLQRKIIAEKLRTLTDQEKRSADICQRINELIPEGAVVGSYMPLLQEVDVSNVHGNICYPVTLQNGVMEFYRFKDERRFIKGKYDIFEPDVTICEKVNPEEMDFVIVPCVGFDDDGRRLGHGAGYYDRYLPNCGKAKTILAAFLQQKLQKVVCDEYDVIMDYIITG